MKRKAIRNLSKKLSKKFKKTHSTTINDVSNDLLIDFQKFFDPSDLNFIRQSNKRLKKLIEPSNLPKGYMKIDNDNIKKIIYRFLIPGNNIPSEYVIKNPIDLNEFMRFYQELDNSKKLKLLIEGSIDNLQIVPISELSSHNVLFANDINDKDINVYMHFIDIITFIIIELDYFDVYELYFNDYDIDLHNLNFTNPTPFINEVYRKINDQQLQALYRNLNENLNLFLNEYINHD